MTIKGHKHRIEHPGYGAGTYNCRWNNDFWFKEDVSKWIRSSRKINQDKSYVNVKAKAKK